MAVKHCLENGVTNLHPASILQLHPNCTYFLDEHSSALLSQRAHSKIINAKNGNH
jgi:glucosamine-6-phosphate deaminase